MHLQLSLMTFSNWSQQLSSQVFLQNNGNYKEHFEIGRVAVPSPFTETYFFPRGISLWRESHIFNCLFLSLNCFFGLSYHLDQFWIFLFNFPTIFLGFIFWSRSANTCSYTHPSSAWGVENASAEEEPPLHREVQQLEQRLWLLLGKHAQYVFHSGIADCFVACFSVDFSLFLLIFLFPGHSCSTLIFQRPVFEQLPATLLGTDLAFLCYLKNKYETIKRKIKITQCFWSLWNYFVWLKYMPRLTNFFSFFLFFYSYALQFLFVPQKIFLCYPVTK